MRVTTIVSLVLALAASGFGAVQTGQVHESLKKARDFLYSQLQNGNWEEVQQREAGNPWEIKSGQWGGLTSLATYALLASGEQPQKNQQLAEAIKWLRSADIVGVYALGMRMQVWLLTSQVKEHREAMRRDMLALLDATKSEGEALGFHDYLVREKTDRYDHSVSQYAVLGLWAADQMGMEVPTKYWKLVEDAWRRDQTGDGGWSYQGRDQPTCSMTAAGIASLFIAQDLLAGPGAGECRGNPPNAPIERAMEWMVKNYNKIHEGHAFYTLYGIERIGVASGYKYFGKTDWYQDGAKWLLEQQQGDGAFGDGSRSEKIYNTCFGVLFLVRGRAPVMMNKLQYAIDFAGDKSKPTNWNNRPRDLSNLANWMTHRLERYINWQIVSIENDPDDWHDAPILYISGNQPQAFKPEEMAKLKQFVEQGGLILAHADCNHLGFANTMEKIGEKMFPAYKWRELPADHLILNQPNGGKNWRGHPPVRGLSNGARELMLVIPAGDPAKYWQLRSFSGQGSTGAQLAENIFLYAANKAELRHKEETYIVRPDPQVNADRKVKVARLLYGGPHANPDPEPGGWRRLAAISHNQFRVDLDVVPITLGQSKLTGDFKVAHLTGTGRFELSKAAMDELKSWLEAGGTLIVDACGGSTEFADAAEAQISGLLAAKPQPPVVAPDHAVFKAAGDFDVRYRDYARKMLVSNLGTPRIRKFEVNNRIAVLFSREDLSVGLVGNSVDGVIGYAPRTAAPMMLSMIFYAGMK